MAKVPLDESADATAGRIGASARPAADHAIGAIGAAGTPIAPTDLPLTDGSGASGASGRASTDERSDWDAGDFEREPWWEHRLLHVPRSWEESGRRWLPGIRYPIAVWAVWRLVHAALVLYLGDPQRRWSTLVNSPFFYDGERYDTIMRHGYELPNLSMPNTAFFPGVSWVAWPIYQLTRSPVLTGHIVATVTGIAAFVTVWGVSRAWQTDEIGRKAVWLLALMPSSLFLWAFYSEGLFIALGAGAVWADRRNRHWLAAGLMLALSTTRSVAILVPLVIILARLIRHRKIDRWCFIYGSAAVVGLLPVLYMMNHYTGDYFAFMRVQADWGRAISAPWTTIGNGIQNLWPEPETIMVPALVSRNLDLWCLPIVGIGIGYAAFGRRSRASGRSVATVSPAVSASVSASMAAVDRLPMEAWMVGVALIILPLCSTSLASFNRFVLADWIIYPAYALLASRLPLWWRRAFWTAMVVALAVTTYHMVGRFSVDRFVG